MRRTDGISLVIIYVSHLKPTSWIFYKDVTNLYGYCLSQKLPISNFKWETYNKDELLEIVKNYDCKTAENGFLVEVDLDIDQSLH